LRQKAAAVTLVRLRVDGAEGHLSRLAREGAPEARVAALNAIGEVPPTRATRDLMLRASTDPSRDVRTAALRGLALHPDAEILDLLVETAVRDPDWGTRWPALIALSEVSPGLVADALDRLRPFLEGTDEKEAEAVQVLESGLDPEFWRQPVRRNENPAACGLEPIDGDPDAPPFFAVRAPAPLGSVRCWRAPGVPGRAYHHRRIPSGDSVSAYDLFELEGELWRRVHSWMGYGLCWLPDSVLERVEPGMPLDQAPAAEPSVAHVEFDLSTIELAGDAARELSGAGLLEIIEPGTEMVGVALETESITEEQLAEFVAAYGDGTSFLDFHIAELLPGLHERFPEDRALGELLVRVDEDPPDPIVAWFERNGPRF
jgi:hypothetical protein